MKRLPAANDDSLFRTHTMTPKRYHLKTHSTASISDFSARHMAIRQQGQSFCETLHRCGLVWEHRKFFSMDGTPLFFTAGQPRQRTSDPEMPTTGASACPENALQANALNSGSQNYDQKRHNAQNTRNEHLERERERDRKRRKKKQKQSCSRLTNRNFLHYMYTFTFAPRLNENVPGLRFILPAAKQKERASVEHVWNKRLTFMRRKFGEKGVEFRYLKVLERHAGRSTTTAKKNTFHIHLATDMSIAKKDLQDLWGYGVVWIDNFNKEKRIIEGRTVNADRDTFILNPGAYMAKYMGKDFEDSPPEKFHRAFSPSKNLIKANPDRDSALIAEMLKNPFKGFFHGDLMKIREQHKGLPLSIESLRETESVKAAEFSADIEFPVFQKGEASPRTSKMRIETTFYNFRKLLVSPGLSMAS